MTEPGMPIPADVIRALTEVAARMAAARSIDVRPTEAVAVATTQAEALRLLCGGSRTPGSEQRPVYVITMRGRFRARLGGLLGRPPEGTVITATFSSRTLRVLDTKISDQDDRALLPRLGPVSILPIEQRAD